MRVSAFLPRGKSKTVFVLAMACYAWVATHLLGTIAIAFGAPRPKVSVLLERGYPMFEVIGLVLFAPVVESLVLMGTIELVRKLRSPVWLQITLPAIISALLHMPPIADPFVVAPAWFIMAAAYLRWRRVSWKAGFVVIASIHALLNLNSAIWAIGYAIHNANV